MGASQSKKRRKVKKKRSSEFDLPRSASADVIRSLAVSNSSCPHCQTLGGSICSRPHSSPPDPFICHHTSLTALGLESTPKPFYHSLEGIPHSSHSSYNRYCLQGHFQNVRDYNDEDDSPPAYVSSNDLSVVSSARSKDSHLNNVSKDDLEGFAFSENGSSGSQRTTFENVYVFDTVRGENKVDGPIVVSCSSRYNDIDSSHYDQTRSQYSLYSQMRRTPTPETMSSEPILQQTESRPMQGENVAYSDTTLKENNNDSKQRHKISFNALEDEIVMAARYEKQKRMAQQLRILRKHIHDHESLNMPPPTPLLYGNDERDLMLAREDQFLTEHQSPETESINGSKGFINDSKPCRKRARNKFTKMSNYKNLDSHPVMSKLQNEQNNRLEDMERRMKQIKMNAMREADRRRFAEIFPAKEDDDKTERLIQEARETLDILKEKKKEIKNINELKQEKLQNSKVYNSCLDENVSSKTRESNNGSELGDIVPVHVSRLAEEYNERNSPEVIRGVKSQEFIQNEKEVRRKSKSEDGLWDFIDLGRPITWIWLPFLVFPLLLRFILSFVFKTSENNRKGSLQQRRDCYPAKEKTN